MNENDFLQHKLWQTKAIIFILGDIEQSNTDVFFQHVRNEEVKLGLLG